MRRIKIYHRTRYSFTSPVELGPHYFLLRPREGHEVHIETSSLVLSPPGIVKWHRDTENNSAAQAMFSGLADELVITSEVICQHYNSAPLDFFVSDYALHYPFTYSPEEAIVLAPYLVCAETVATGELNRWVAGYWQSGTMLETYALLENLCSGIQQSMQYVKREDPGVQSAAETLTLQSGSCRDFANLFMEATRMLGIASRFVSGYLYNPPSTFDFGATHAWAEVFLPGAGWKGFDPTVGKIADTDHIPVAVSRRSDSIPPVSGSFIGSAESSLEVEVQVSDW